MVKFGDVIVDREHMAQLRKDARLNLPPHPLRKGTVGEPCRTEKVLVAIVNEWEFSRLRHLPCRPQGIEVVGPDGIEVVALHEVTPQSPLQMGIEAHTGKRHIANSVGFVGSIQGFAVGQKTTNQDGFPSFLPHNFAGFAHPLVMHQIVGHQDCDAHGLHVERIFDFAEHFLGVKREVALHHPSVVARVFAQDIGHRVPFVLAEIENDLTLFVVDHPSH